MIAPGGPAIVTEGISDYHAYLYYCSEELREAGITLVPGMGDSSHDPLISTLISKGVGFVVLLDDDRSGARSASRYREKWLLDQSSIATVGELVPSCSGRKLETLLSDETRQSISAHFCKKGAPSKKEIGLYFLEAQSGLITDKSVETANVFAEILSKAMKLLQ